MALKHIPLDTMITRRLIIHHIFLYIAFTGDYGRKKARR
jgi:hypothetical protein